MNSLIAFDLDQSSSMNGELTKDAFNKFLTMMQYRIDDCELYLAAFDDYYTPLVEFQSIFEVPMMSIYEGGGVNDDGFATSLHYQPRGSTLLNDSVTITVENVLKHLKTLPANEQPTNVTLVIQTDGGNNRGHVQASTVNKVLEDCMVNKGWNVLFLADCSGWSNEALTQARDFGVPDANIIKYKDTKEGFGEAATKILESVVTGKIGRV